ncbi:hypothetical protein, partial [Klebsiella pneumoniae]|uniref:hypothetical protein n=1 Tax=Klebsiella pneumoniae TaxID=573 RepID=UPI001F4B3176
MNNALLSYCYDESTLDSINHLSINQIWRCAERGKRKRGEGKHRRKKKKKVKQRKRQYKEKKR